MNETVPEQSPPASESTEAHRPQGCLTAALAVVVFGCIGLIGCAWLGSFLPELPNASTPLVRFGIPAAYALLLVIPFGLIALFLRQPRFGLWRGLALAIALVAGHAGIVGSVHAAAYSGREMLLPYWLPSLVSILYSASIMVVMRSRLFTRPAVGPVILGAALGLVLSLGWLWAGSLGTLTEIGLSLLDALSTALIGALALRAIFLFDFAYPAQRPFWAALLGGLVLVGLETGMLAVRGYFLQGIYLSAALVPACLIAAALLTLDAEPDAGRLWWAGLACLLISTAVPYNFGEGFEGDYMMTDLGPAWGWAALSSLVLGVVLVVGLLAARRWQLALTLRPPVPAVTALVAVLISLGVYGFSVQPGIAPDTFFVVMKDQADTTAAHKVANLADRRAQVYSTLTTAAGKSQADLRAWLDSQKIAYKPYYLVNGLEVFANPLIRAQIAARPDVARILDSPHARPLPSYVERLQLPADGSQPNGPTWGVKILGADKVWQQYHVTGQGIVVGSADTGVDWTHPALFSQYLGSQGHHDYTWYDPWYGHAVPDDLFGHGTHTTGTVVGQNGIGVAPGAKFIACRNLGRDLGNPPVYLACMQFLFAPFPQGGDAFRQGDPSRGADVVNNSWGCPPPEGCDASTLSIAVDHLYDAGQMYVISAGNDGPDCSTVWPPANAGHALSVGAVSEDGTITSFSSRGPVIADGSGRIKPDIVAPGFDVLSSVPGGGYASIPGTSMAGPHVAGVVALLWSADPSLKGDIARTMDIIEKTARHESAPDLCGSSTGNANNVYGYGLIDALAAVKMALGQ